MESNPTTPSAPRVLQTLAIVALAPSLGTIAALILWPGAVGGTIYALCKIVLYGLPAVIAWRTIQRTEVLAAAKRGCSRNALLFGFGSGLLVGILIIGCWWGGLRDTLDLTRLTEVVRSNGLNEKLPYLLAAIWLSLGNAFLEEFSFRWFVDTRLEMLGTGRVTTMLISGVIFTAHHVIVLGAYFNVLPTIFFSLGVFVGGVAWSWSRKHWQSLLPGWISHGLLDMAIFFVGWQMLFG